MKSIEDTLEFVGGLLKAVAGDDEVSVTSLGARACISRAQPGPRFKRIPTFYYAPLSTGKGTCRGHV